MALGAVVGAALTTPTARKWTLTIGGLDVSIQLGGAKGTSYGVPIDSIRLVEVATDGVSSLAFDIDDPAGVLVFEERAPVHFHDHVRDLPLFDGFLDTIRVAQVGLARRHTVQCVGIEAVLDWMVLPDTVTIAVVSGGPSPPLSDVVQALVGQALGVGVPLRALMNVGGQSTAAKPIADLNSQSVSTGASGDLALGGRTLRQAIVTCALLTGTVLPAQLTVDFYGGVRLMGSTGYGGGYGGNVLLVARADATGLVVDGATFIGAEASVGANFGEAIHQVYVQGGNAAGSGVVTDGSGIRGPIATASEPLSTTAGMRNSLGASWLARRGALIYGKVRIEDQANAGAAGAERRAYGTIQINNPEMGFTGGTVAILPMQRIAKSFRSGGQEVWEVDAGSKVTGAGGFMRRIVPTAI